MSCLTFLFLYAGLVSQATNVFSIPLSQDVRDAIDEYVSQKQQFRSNDALILSNRLEEMESMRAKDVEFLTDRLTEVENMRAKDVEILTSRLAEEENMRAKDVEMLTNRITEVENIRGNDLQLFTNRLLEVGNMRAKELEIITSRLTEVENMCNKDVEILTSGIPEVKIISSKEVHAQINRSSEVESIYGKNDVKDLTNRLKDLTNNNSKDVKTLTKLPAAFQAQSIAKRTPLKMRPRVASVIDWVAFHAILPVTIHDPAPGHIVPYSNMKTNIGTGYDAKTGVFTCNTPGLYVFSWSIRIAEPAHGLETELILNGATVGYNTSGGGDNSAWGYGSATVTLYLQERDEVWVRSAEKVAGVSIVSNSMFTGFLLHT
ncbi:uncharacterized protein LOC110467147 [Mizuhopecten yessoensis]|uniref:C1q-related factor n=1 Tax=Mizuhopecten yessoensis TaxID=6573 RepID=A0A210PMM3_MIZYE|nr:uncharacterized protein LOC110467147 [Mizuhopecten yessoensis]OWF37714.1 C1q-related factor [Mizuhopecten yessoensis]